DVSADAAKASYERMRQAYTAVFDRIGLTYRLVAADPGAIGGSTSAEFQVLADSGEDAIVACNKCDYAANVEIATVKAPAVEGQAEPAQDRVKVHTPKVGTIEDVSKFLKVPPNKFL